MEEMFKKYEEMGKNIDEKLRQAAVLERQLTEQKNAIKEL